MAEETAHGAFGWFWTSDTMVALQAWVDTTRALIDPLTGLTGVMVVFLFIMWRLGRPASCEDGDMPGRHYLGRITPKRIDAMAKNLRIRPPRSRREMERAVRKAARKRRETDPHPETRD